jgi:hypothetical protein
MKYQRKQLQIQAVQFDGTKVSTKKILAMLEDNNQEAVASSDGSPTIQFSKSNHRRVAAGTWVVVDKGVTKLCTEDKFHAEYEEVK